jgi:uncharacterized SAM-binding protein YcdF (DUF218 family)
MLFPISASASVMEADANMQSTNGTSNKNATLRVRFVLITLAALLLLVTTIGLVVFFDLGKWLVRQDPLQQSKAIAVLSGGVPTRALEAAALYHEGFAKEIWLTHPDVHDDALKQLGISVPSEDDFNTRILRRAGVPLKAIHVLDTPIVNTDEELAVIGSALQASGGKRVIIVTNSSHTRRVHILWTKFYGSRGTAIVHAVPDDEYVANRWWRDPVSMAQVSHEFFGILNAWAGLPVRRVAQPVPEVVAEGPHTAAAQPQPANAD